MCGRVVSATPSDAMAAIFGAELAIAAGDEPDYNLAPTDPIRAVVDRGEGRQLRRFRWGLVPSSAKGVGDGPLMINARAESVTSKGVFARLLGHRRCAVPVDGFYEWEKVGGERLPFLASPAGGGLLVLAGLWDVWRRDETVVPSLTIVTTTANGTMRAVHDRMPVVLAADAWERWLDPGLTDIDEIEGLLVPAPDDAILLRRTSMLVNSVRNKGPEVLEPPGPDETGENGGKGRKRPAPTEVQESLDLG